MFALAFGGQKQTGQHTVGMGAVMRAGAEADFSKDHHVAQGLFGLVISGWNVWVFQKGKEAIVFFFGAE